VAAMVAVVVVVISTSPQIVKSLRYFSSLDLIFSCSLHFLIFPELHSLSFHVDQKNL